MSGLLALTLRAALNSPVMKAIPGCTNLEHLYLELRRLTISRLLMGHYCTDQPTDVVSYTVQLNAMDRPPHTSDATKLIE